MACSSRSVAKGFLAGCVGGAVGTAVLTAFQMGSLQGTEWMEDKLGSGHRLSREQKGLMRMFETAHVKTAEAVTDAVHVRLSRSQKRTAAPVMEFAFGILCAGVYGAIAEYVPAVTAGYGTLYGAALFTGASEVVLPAMGYVPQPKKRAASQHIGGLSGNVLYGAVTEGVRRLLG